IPHIAVQISSLNKLPKGFCPNFHLRTLHFLKTLKKDIGVPQYRGYYCYRRYDKYPTGGFFQLFKFKCDCIVKDEANDVNLLNRKDISKLFQVNATLVE